MTQLSHAFLISFLNLFQSFLDKWCTVSFTMLSTRFPNFGKHFCLFCILWLIAKLFVLNLVLFFFFINLRLPVYFLLVLNKGLWEIYPAWIFFFRKFMLYFSNCHSMSYLCGFLVELHVCDSFCFFWPDMARGNPSLPLLMTWDVNSHLI